MRRIFLHLFVFFVWGYGWHSTQAIENENPAATDASPTVRPAAPKRPLPPPKKIPPKKGANSEAEGEEPAGTPAAAGTSGGGAKKNSQRLVIVVGGGKTSVSPVAFNAELANVKAEIPAISGLEYCWNAEIIYLRSRFINYTFRFSNMLANKQSTASDQTSKVLSRFDIKSFELNAYHFLIFKPSFRLYLGWGGGIALVNGAFQGYISSAAEVWGLEYTSLGMSGNALMGFDMAISKSVRLNFSGGYRIATFDKIKVTKAINYGFGLVEGDLIDSTLNPGSGLTMDVNGFLGQVALQFEIGIF